MADANDFTGRIEKKLDFVNRDVRELTSAIHEQSLAIVKLCEQMHHSTEAISRAHSRIDEVDKKVEALRDCPTKIDYLEKRIDHIALDIDSVRDTASGSEVKIATTNGAAGLLSKVWPFLVTGAVLAAAGLISKIGGK